MEKRDENRIGSTFLNDEPFRITSEDGDWKRIPGHFVPVHKEMRWGCLRCGWCCSQEWQIDLSWTEYERLKGHLSLDNAVRDESTGEYYPCYRPVGGCEAYDESDKKCTIYDERPFICRSFPFYLYPPCELYVSTLCRGLGKGPVIDTEGIRKELLSERRAAGMSMTHYSDPWGAGDVHQRGPAIRKYSVEDRNKR